jgi:hypothetical protein
MSTTIDDHRQTGEGFSSPCRTGSSEVGDAGVASAAPSRRRRGRSVAEEAVAISPPEQHQRSSSHTTASPPQQQHPRQYTTVKQEEPRLWSHVTHAPEDASLVAASNRRINSWQSLLADVGDGGDKQRRAAARSSATRRYAGVHA